MVGFEDSEDGDGKAQDVVVSLMIMFFRRRAAGAPGQSSTSKYLMGHNSP